MSPNLPSSISWLLLIALPVFLICFLSSCGCCGRGSCHPKNAPCRSCFEERPIKAHRRTYPVDITRTEGRVVLLLHEINGQSPGVLWLAQEMAKAGCKVYVPRFFGSYGADHGLLYTVSVPLFCRDWHFFSLTDTGPIRKEVQALTTAIAKENPGRSITVIGSCMSGSLPLELLQLDCVDTAVICQPAVPFLARSPAAKTSFGLPEEVIGQSIATLKKNPKKQLINFNYLDDHIGVIERCANLAERTQKADVAGQHLMFIGAGPCQSTCCRSSGGKKLPQGATPLTTSTATGHSTVTGAEGGDLKIFRQQLFKVLGLHTPATP